MPNIKGKYKENVESLIDKLREAHNNEIIIEDNKTKYSYMGIVV